MTEWIALDVPDTIQAPGLARQFVRDHASGLPGEVVDDAQLLVSELVTNAVRHGRPGITVRLRADASKLDVAVEDHGEQMPNLPRGLPTGSSETGRGLLILDALSQSWGVSVAGTPPGKTVWFELLPSAR